MAMPRARRSADTVALCTRSPRMVSGLRPRLFVRQCDGVADAEAHAEVFGADDAERANRGQLCAARITLHYKVIIDDKTSAVKSLPLGPPARRPGSGLVEARPYEQTRKRECVFDLAAEGPERGCEIGRSGIPGRLRNRLPGRLGPFDRDQRNLRRSVPVVLNRIVVPIVPQLSSVNSAGELSADECAIPQNNGERFPDHAVGTLANAGMLMEPSMLGYRDLDGTVS